MTNDVETADYRFLVDRKVLQYSHLPTDYAFESKIMRSSYIDGRSSSVSSTLRS